MAGSSRQLFAFARDGAVPFSQWVAYVRRSYRVLRIPSDKVLGSAGHQSTTQRRHRHLCHCDRHCSHQHRKHNRIQHCHLSWYWYIDGVLHHLSLVHGLAQDIPQAATAISFQHGPSIWTVCQSCCARMALPCVYHCILPTCSDSIVDSSGHELVGCGVERSGTLQHTLLHYLGPQELCRASRVRQKAGVRRYVITTSVYDHLVLCTCSSDSS